MAGRLFGRSAVVMAVVALMAAAGAQAAGEPMGQPIGDSARGAKKIYTCYGCHGIESYRNAYPNYSVPKLKGQHAAYLVSALGEYQKGERPHATMHAQSVSLNAEDIADIAAFLQGSEPIKPSTESTGTAPVRVATCASCHGANGLGVDAPLEPKPPILAGQHADYLEQALSAYRNGRRKNLVMGGMAQSLTDEDIKALAAYFSKQASPLATAKHP
jgi:cytochrome c553